MILSIVVDAILMFHYLQFLTIPNPVPILIPEPTPIMESIPDLESVPKSNWFRNWNWLWNQIQ